MFVGDTVWPGKQCIDIEPIIPVLRGKRLILNLEGPVLDGQPHEWVAKNPYKISLNSDPEVIFALQKLGVAACGLANNHINDYVGSVVPTIASLSAADIGYFGTGDRPVTEMESPGARWVVIGACSRLPEPRVDSDEVGPQLFSPQKMIDLIVNTRRENPEAVIVFYVHWGYELSLYPEPADREWAHRAIEAGANAVIGHHPHVVQGIERIGDGFIAYSLGNFIMPHGWFNGRWQGFLAQEVLIELGVEVGRESIDLHWFGYDKDESRLFLLEGETDFDADAFIENLTPFRGMSHRQYRKWFSKYGVHGHLSKRRAGPIYRSYFGVGRLLTAGNDGFMLVKRRARKVLMGAGIHKPTVN